MESAVFDRNMNMRVTTQQHLNSLADGCKSADRHFLFINDSTWGFAEKVQVLKYKIIFIVFRFQNKK